MLHEYYGSAFMNMSPSDMFIMIIFWIGIILFLVYIINDKKGLTNSTHHKPNSSHEPLHILKERYARGEIDKKEFEEKYADLSK